MKGGWVVADKDTRSRKYQLTINNPLEYGFSHEKIKEMLLAFESLVYFCMADEIGDEGKTPHTHVYMHCSSAVRFSTIKKAFPQAHIEHVRGTAAQNRAYIAKEGKWENDEKGHTKVEGTFEEWGDMPVERQGQRTDLTRFHSLIRDGASNCQIYEDNPNNIKYANLIDRVRQDIRREEFKDKFRKMEVIYMYGKTGVGKTRMILERYCPSDVYRVTDYKHPFDGYQGQPVIVFDEFRSQLYISDMLNYTDGYPLELPARYSNRQACYTTVYIVSNWTLREQYPNVQKEDKETMAAFLRRVHHLWELTPDGIIEHDIQAHMSGFTPLPDDTPIPWEKPPEQEQIKTLEEDDGRLPF
jgi:hypothetical protein